MHLLPESGFSHSDFAPAILGYAAQQRLVPRAVAVDELFDEVTRSPGGFG